MCKVILSKLKVRKNYPQAYQEWLRVVFKQMSHLSKPQAAVLGMWSLAIAMTHSCGLSTAAVFLAQILDQPENTVKERLRQWYCQSRTLKGRKRSQIDVEQSFVPLLRWILSWWSSSEKIGLLPKATVYMGFTNFAVNEPHTVNRYLLPNKSLSKIFRLL